MKHARTFGNDEVSTSLHTQTSQRAGKKRSDRSISRLTGALGSAFVGATLMLFPMAANAQDNTSSVQTVDANTVAPQSITLNTPNSRILPDAHRPANVWAVENPNGVAVSLRLGTDTIPVDTIENVLKADFQRVGINDVAFFFEQGNSAGTGVAFHTDKYVYGPYTLVEARKAIPTDASQIKFNANLQLEP